MAHAYGNTLPTGGTNSIGGHSEMVTTLEGKKGQKGFTLIEIIAVLVILGILAAVAVPKYLDMQTEAAKKAVSGGLAALASQVTMNYARDIMASPSLASTWVPSNNSMGTTFTVGDFVGTASVATGAASVGITSGLGAASGWLGQVTATSDLSRSFSLY